MPHDDDGQIGIVRVRKNKENPYVMIARSALEDKSMSWEARGVLAYLLCKPDNWQISMVDLVKQGPGARDRMKRIMRELTSAGYVRRKRVHASRGRFEWISEVYETPE